MELGFFLKKKLYLSQELNGYQFDGLMKWYPKSMSWNWKYEIIMMHLHLMERGSIFHQIFLNLVLGFFFIFLETMDQREVFNDINQLFKFNVDHGWRMHVFQCVFVYLECVHILQQSPKEIATITQKDVTVNSQTFCFTFKNLETQIWF